MTFGSAIAILTLVATLGACGSAHEVPVDGSVDSGPGPGVDGGSDGSGPRPDAASGGESTGRIALATTPTAVIRFFNDGVHYDSERGERCEARAHGDECVVIDCAPSTPVANIEAGELTVVTGSGTSTVFTTSDGNYSGDPPTAWTTSESVTVTATGASVAAFTLEATFPSIDEPRGIAIAAPIVRADGYEFRWASSGSVFRVSLLQEDAAGPTREAVCIFDSTAVDTGNVPASALLELQPGNVVVRVIDVDVARVNAGGVAVELVVGATESAGTTMATLL